MIKDKKINWLFALSLLILSACGGGGETDPEGGNTPDTVKEVPVRGDYVRVHLPAEPDKLNPFNSTHANATYVKFHLFQYVLNIDAQTQELEPVIAKARPTFSEDGMNMTFELREEATWDDGTPITGEDYKFSIKVQKNPKVDCPNSRTYIDFIQGVEIDPNNPKKFTVITNSKYFRNEAAVGGVPVIAKHLYDPEGLMDKFTISQLNEDADALLSDPDINKFAEMFNSEDYSRAPEKIMGSGPYRLEAWVPGQSLTLVRKQDWWGDKVKDGGPSFEAYPEKLIFKIINDKATAVTALKAEEIDVMRGIPPKDFKDFKDGKGIVPEKFNLHNPDMFAYTYIALNQRPPSGRKPFFKDAKTRRAMAHLMDIDMLIKNIYYGFGSRIASPISPLRTEEYHNGLKPIQHDPEKAKALLAEAGWEDTDGDGLLDMDVDEDGKRDNFEVNFMVSNSSVTATSVARHLAEEAENLGIKINLNTMNFTVMTDRLRKHDFDLYGAGFASPPLPTDLKQVFHTDFWANEGSNYFGYGNARSDSLMDMIRTVLDPQERKPIYYELQQMIYDDQPIIFVMNPKEKICIHKRFRNALSSSVRPGFEPHRFWAPAEEQKFTADKAN